MKSSIPRIIYTIIYSSILAWWTKKLLTDFFHIDVTNIVPIQAINKELEHTISAAKQLLENYQYGFKNNTIDVYSPDSPKPVKAAFVILVRNEELYKMKASMQGIEDRFNRKFNYPYVFLNDVPFTEAFKVNMRAMTKAKIEFGLIDKNHWGYPEHINQTYAAECRKKMAAEGVLYGSSESYRHMCRFNSGFFFEHPLVADLEYYWRIEPEVTYSCDIDYDPFIFMKENDIKYGFTIALYEYYNTIPTLWNSVKNFAKQYTHLIPKNNSLTWISHNNGTNFSGCHFWSNFEIGSLQFLRSKEYRTFFQFLDNAGGFFYERWGDAPVHSIAAAMFLAPQQIHWFEDIGYKHAPWENCPQNPDRLLKCSCDPATSAIHSYYAKCTIDWNSNVTAISPDIFASS
ncbi:Glycolipid 2-alpha-mannosyltransferase 1 [Smittium culicis]|uniref:Glycolipid 2-alpha-mannosyltransferase 1 n=2 Tax=Smittium culicis TaxID=133412 RepID=A0A1R1Y6C6_9FUNG|nr:Glycolipid 2-alpha-mannosyltransferase 1 [Smittium culicis]